MQINRHVKINAVNGVDRREVKRLFIDFNWPFNKSAMNNAIMKIELRWRAFDVYSLRLVSDLKGLELPKFMNYFEDT